VAAETLTAEATDARPAYRRRHYLLDRRFQLRHTIGLSLVSLAISAAFGATMYQVHLENTALLKVTPEFMPLVKAADQDTLLLIVASTLGIAFAMVFVGIWATHRIAGPLWVIAHYLDILGKGRYPRMRPLRKGDQLLEFFERVGGAVDGMRTRDRAEAGELEAVAQLAASDPAAAADRLRALAAGKRRNADELVERPTLDQLPKG
jgi:hypothetical protein